MFMLVCMPDMVEVVRQQTQSHLRRSNQLQTGAILNPTRTWSPFYQDIDIMFMDRDS
jgi:hypothetical protein